MSDTESGDNKIGGRGFGGRGAGGGRSSVRQSFSHGRSKAVVVETKRKRILTTRDGAPKTAAAAAAAEAGTAPLPGLRVRALFRAQIEAAIAVQQAVLAAPPDPNVPSLDLETELRPALLRIGDRIAWLLVRLPGPLDPGDVDRQTSEALDAPGLERHHEAAIADAIAQLSRYRS